MWRVAIIWREGVRRVARHPRCNRRSWLVHTILALRAQRVHRSLLRRSGRHCRSPPLRLRTKLIIVLMRHPKYNRTRNRRGQSKPNEHHSRDCPPIMSVLQRAAAIQPQQCLRLIGIHARDVRLVRRRDDREGQRGREHHDASEDAADFPRQTHGAGFVAFGPEEVEEEGCAEDGGDVYADEDVEGGDADVVVVVFDGMVIEVVDVFLLVDVVCVQIKSCQFSGLRDGRGCGDWWVDRGRDAAFERALVYLRGSLSC